MQTDASTKSNAMTNKKVVLDLDTKKIVLITSGCSVREFRTCYENLWAGMVSDAIIDPEVMKVLKNKFNKLVSGESNEVLFRVAFEMKIEDKIREEIADCGYYTFEAKVDADEYHDFAIMNTDLIGELLTDIINNCPEDDQDQDCYRTDGC